ncbi:hypothetical protein [Streptomyces sp. NPDC060027]|uniref:hypothetical protein n=1 Tax=Streptomyces sp. NPDC060027 TaxID=3347040 RepID=UPI0036C100D7
MLLLVGVIEHAHTQLSDLSDADAVTVSNASGADLLQLLRTRVGAATAHGRQGIPMLVSEIRYVEAAVVNLESYEGHESVLCEGYAILERLSALQKSASGPAGHQHHRVAR